MSDEREPARAPRRYAPTLIVFVAHAVAAYAFTTAFRGPWQLVLALLSLVLAHFLAALVHELGHVLAALACRYRIVMIAVRPFGLQVPNRNLVLVPWRYNDGAGGWVAAVPRSAAADTRLAYAIWTAAGPAASFLLAAVAIWQAASILPPPAGLSVKLPNLWFGFAVLALHGGVLSLLAGDNGSSSDGDHLRAVWKADHGDFLVYRPWSWMSGMTQLKVQLRDLPEWMLGEARRSAEQSEWMARYVAEVEIGRLLDDPPVDPEAARALLDDFRERYGSNNWLASCDAYCAVIWEDDPERAETALAEVQPPSEVPAMTAAAEAALAARIGDEGTVQAKLAEMRKALKAASPFRDDTFAVLAAQIEARLARTLSVSPVRP